MSKINELLQSENEITRDNSTKINYNIRAEQLIRRCHKELNLLEDQQVDPRQLVVWLNSSKVNYSRPTWRQYKSAVIFYLENHKDIKSAIEAIDYIKNKDSSGCVLDSSKTSSQKLKKITFEDWQKLDTYLATNNGKWFEALRFWLRSSIITGLRPIEWRKTKFYHHDDKYPALLVENAKNTNNRSHGVTRTLLLENLNSDDLIAIKNHLSNVRNFGIVDYEYFYTSCATTLYKISRKLWPRRKKHITLYSTRHQFSANAKNSGFSKEQIAAMMGHAVDITATIHYGRKKSGNEPVNIQPIQKEVDKVRHIEATDFKEMVKNKQDNNA